MEREYLHVQHQQGWNVLVYVMCAIAFTAIIVPHKHVLAVCTLAAAKQLHIIFTTATTDSFTSHFLYEIANRSQNIKCIH